MWQCGGRHAWRSRMKTCSPSQNHPFYASLQFTGRAEAVPFSMQFEIHSRKNGLADSRFIGKSLTNQARHQTRLLLDGCILRLLTPECSSTRLQQNRKSGSRDSSDYYDSSKLWLQPDSSGIIRPYTAFIAVWWTLRHILVGIPRYLVTSKESMVQGSELGSAEGHKDHRGLWSSTNFRHCEETCRSWILFQCCLGSILNNGTAMVWGMTLRWFCTVWFGFSE